MSWFSGFRQGLHFHLEDLDNNQAQVINLILLFLIVVSSVFFVLETYPLTPEKIYWLILGDRLILIIFSLEYGLRLLASENPRKFALSFYGLVDLIAIAPLYFGMIDVRFIRVFRWLRILRLFRLFEFELKFLDINSKDTIIFTRIFLILFSIVFIYAGLIYQIEHKNNPQIFQNFFDAFYFAVVTMTTVGFGDKTPISDGGKWLTLVMILTGVAVVPWQVGELVKQLIKTSNRSGLNCQECGLGIHDLDANFCKICGAKLSKQPLESTQLKDLRNLEQ